jgi:ubiquinone/menaquinone biosynthesis C-methylase UbiE
MTMIASINIFNIIAPVYGLFYKHQKTMFHEFLDRVEPALNLREYSTAVDIGCGTGALCAVLDERGFDVTGVDPAEKMLNIARKRNKDGKIRFVQASGLERLPFEDNSFDFSLASYVCHGLKEHERQLLYSEMSRISRHLVIIGDYNQKRSLSVDVAEWFEGGDYFNFIKTAEHEMRSSFREVIVFDAGPRTALYICTPLKTPV